MDFARLALACVLHIMGGGEPTASCQNDFFYEVALAVEGAAVEYGVSPDLIAAVIYSESRFDVKANSPKGAIGLMQVLRHGAVQGPYLKMSRKALSEVRLNIDIGTAYLAQVLPQCKSLTTGLTLYNRGPAKGCAPSAYSRGVLRSLRRGRRDIATVRFIDYLRLLYSVQEPTS